MAKYNKWINNKLYDIAATLSDEEVAADKGAFFGSILGTLNHIMVGDIIWLQRFAGHPSKFKSLDFVRSLPTPVGLGVMLYSNLTELRQARTDLDDAIVRFSIELSEDDADSELEYSNTKGNSFQNKLGALILHFFNHQTHHRGQITTLLNQANIDIGMTDLLFTIREGNV